mgnify:CR=1
MEDFALLLGLFATGSLAINLYLIKSVAGLCERIVRLETKIQHSQ